MSGSDRLFDLPSDRDSLSEVAGDLTGRGNVSSLRVYTDGACSGNPGPGGWAWVVPDGPFAAGYEARTTNQRMELTATLEAVGRFEGPVTVVSDSTYVVHCFRDGWWEKWLRKGWVNAKKEPVANRDLWEPLVAAVVERDDVSFEWVKGHSGDRWNDVADRLAVDAGNMQAALSGDVPPR
ncbi:MAG: ribonuclease H [Actinomycetota bacterium]|nr:ribonuclease H [Actinomycetota bacterium]MEC9424304.1 ribonuclease H [Actinomycetota bacterium]